MSFVISTPRGGPKLLVLQRCLRAARATPWYAQSKTEKREVPLEKKACTVVRNKQVRKEDSRLQQQHGESKKAPQL